MSDRHTFEPDDDARRLTEFGQLVDGYDEAERMKEISAAAIERELHADETFVQSSWRRFARNRLALVGLTVLWLMVVMSIVAPMAASPEAFEKTFVVEGPSREHPLGTTRQGQDMWTAVWLGGRVSLAVAAAVAFVIFVVGTAYGAIAGYFGGWLDNLMMRLLDALYGLPYVPLAAIIVVIFQDLWGGVPPLVYVAVALSVVSWFTAARLMRGEMLVAREKPYVESARSSGASSGRIIWRHLLRNTLGILIVSAFLEIPAAIIGESILSFLGLGIPPGEPSWGALANLGFGQMHRHPMLIIAPGMAIAITVIAATAVADGLRDALDVRSDNR